MSLANLKFSYEPSNTFKKEHEMQENPNHDHHDVLCEDFFFKTLNMKYVNKMHMIEEIDWENFISGQFYSLTDRLLSLTITIMNTWLKFLHFFLKIKCAVCVIKSCSTINCNLIVCFNRFLLYKKNPLRLIFTRSFLPGFKKGHNYPRVKSILFVSIKTGHFYPRYKMITRVALLKNAHFVPFHNYV